MAIIGAKAHQKTAFITGASVGIGKAAALALMRAGYRVIGTSRSAKRDEVRDGIRMIGAMSHPTSQSRRLSPWRTPN
jgi:NAD(P)-dependent dehydrogenase (short-subunit alcohol dehydrogenase family)